MEKNWPPLETCPQYEYGMLHPFMKKFDWEDDELSEEIIHYYSDDNESEGGRRKIKFKPRSLKTFLDQVRHSRGYEVNIRPPSFMNSPFWPVRQGTYEGVIRKSIELALGYIDSKTGKTYQHVETLNAVYTANRILLLTFTAKEAAPDAEKQTFLTTVFAPPHALEKESELLECLIKPEGPAPFDLV